MELLLGFGNWIVDALNAFSGILWGPWTFFVLLGAGVLFTLWTRGIQWQALTHGFAVLTGRYDHDEDPGAISHFQALSAALSGTVGLGNIGGVALAIAIGGPGALFWMWVVAALGMAIKAVEVTMALMYRNVDDPKKPSGGAMWVIERTMGARGGKWKVLARVLGTFFCFTLLVSTITGGNVFQAWNVAEITQTYLSVPQLVTTGVLTLLVAAVCIGGIRRIGRVAGALVPLMVALYIAAALVVVAMYWREVPGMLLLVVKSALSPSEASGSFLGAGAYFGFKIGLQRALFSNEAGQGSAPIAHAAARTKEPSREGIVAGLEPFIDTIVICTLTALVILVTGTWNRDGLGVPSEPLSIVAAQDDGSTTYTVSPDLPVSALPARQGLETWSVGDDVFVLGQAVTTDGAVATSLSEGQSRIQLRGTVQSTDAGPMVVWTPYTLDPDAFDVAATRIEMVDASVHRRYDGAPLTAQAFDRAIPGLGMVLVTFASWLFALSTMISWYYYGEQGVVYLGGTRWVPVYAGVFLVATFTAPILARGADALLVIIDFGTGMMLWGNIPILLLAGGLAVADLRSYSKRLAAGDFEAERTDLPKR